MRPVRDAVAAALLFLPGLLSAEALPEGAVPAADAAKVAAAVEVVGPLDLVEYPTARVVGEEEARAAGAGTLASVLALVLGASPVRVGDRAEAGFQLRGFDLRRVPVYVDGIPVYVPFDGVVDLDRFLMAATGGIVVNSGFSSLTYGPNALGGTVNLLRRRPERPLEGRVSAGGGSGGRGSFEASAGSAGKGWYVEGTAAHRRVDDALGTGTELQREGTFSRDTLATLTFGLRPAEGHEVSLSVIRQDGEKGHPPYAGDDPKARVRFWRWPDWDKRSVYLRSAHRLGERWELRATLFHDRFANTLDAFDDASYSTQSLKSSFRSEYDDHTNGGSLQLRRSRPERRTTVAIHAKEDVHRDRTNASPWSRYDDETYSLAWEEEVRVGSLARLVLGTSVDGQRTAAANGLPCGSTTAVNATAALFRPLGPATELHVSLSRRTRLPTLKDRYSYRLGVSEPNPQLGPETALSAEAGVGGSWGGTGRWGAAAYWTTLDDAIESVPVSPNVEQYRNVGSVRHLGVEASLERPLGPRLEAGVRAAFLRRSRLSGPAVALTGVPDLRATAWLSARATRALSVRVAGELEGGRTSRTPSGATRELGGFALLHAAARLGLGHGLELDVRCDNALDRRYSREEGYPEAARSFGASLTWAY